MTSPGPTVDPLFLSFQLALAGRYSIDRELGRGGMGVVYLAREVHLDRMVAIKLLPPDKSVDPLLRDRFLREARLAAKLSHPNIIPIHAVDEMREFVFYVMAFIDGETLAERVRTRGPLASTEGARVLREVAWALGHAHSHGLVHRDVKPDNILLENSTGRVVVADFGIAAAAREIAGTNVSGTPEFMSPEQALGHSVDARSDLYGLGVTAFYAFSGQLPFEGNSATEVLAKQVANQPPALASMGMPVSRKIAALVDRCLAKDPRHRPASAEALAEQLGLALEQRREMPAALRAFVKRNSRLNGGGTMLLPFLMLSGSTLISAYFGGMAGLTAFVVGMVGFPLVYLVQAARELLKFGFGFSDVGPAYATEIEQILDERAAGGMVRGPTFAEKTLRAIMRVSWFATGLSILYNIIMFRSGDYVLLYAALPAIGLGSGIVTTVAYLYALDRRRDVDSDFWAKVWSGRIGKFVFGIAKRFLGKGVRAVPITHRATELSLGMAADSLFEALSPATRQSLGNLPALVHKLQDDAQRLRKLYDDLQEGIASSGDAASSEEFSDLRAQRDVIHAKLGQAVGALETIRLNLLRIHAGSGSLKGLTTHIELAAEVSAEVARMLAAREEVDRSLSFPRRVAATPA